MEAETVCTVTDAVSVKEENVEEKSEENEEIAEEGEENTEKYWVKLGDSFSNIEQLLDWKYSDFDIAVCVDTQIHHLVEILKKKHGRISKVVLCKDEFREANELEDLQKTLKSYGITGSASKEDAPTVKICYDFKPEKDGSPDPILLSWLN